MIAALRNLYHTVKAALFGTLVENATVPEVTAGGDSSSSSPISAPVTGMSTPVESTINPESARVDPVMERKKEPDPVPAGLEEWSVHPYVDPVFEKVGRVFLDAGDLVIRSDRDSRGFALPEEDLDLALTGSTGTVRLLDSFEIVGTAHLSTSGLALNLIIDTQLHTVPMRSLMPVLTGHHRKAPLFVPAEDLAPD